MAITKRKSPVEEEDYQTNNNNNNKLLKSLPQFITDMKMKDNITSKPMRLLRSSSSVGSFMMVRARRLPTHVFVTTVAMIATVALVGIYYIMAGGGTTTTTTTAATLSAYPSGHIVVIDAGSSGSRAHVFRYSDYHKIDPAHESFKEKPGLSSFATHPQDAGASMDALLQFARQHVPASEASRTRIVLKATAGMRLLDTDAQRNAILKSVSDTLLASEFQFNPRDAQVIDGKEEGMLGWLSVNYLNRAASRSSSSTSKTNSDDQWGVLEMGGASVQFTMPMQPSDTAAVPDEHKLSYRVAGSSSEGQVFTHSFLGLGMESARKAVNDALIAEGKTEDPCLPTNYVEEHDANEFSGAKDMTAGM